MFSSEKKRDEEQLAADNTDKFGSNLMKALGKALQDCLGAIDAYMCRGDSAQRKSKSHLGGSFALFRFDRTLSAAKLLTFCLAFVLAACATQTKPPTFELPEQMNAPAAEFAGLDRWWMLFNDAQLTALIEEALQNNLDLRAAVARIDEARATLAIARSSLFPSLDASAQAARSRRSGATPFAFGPPISTVYDAGLRSAYEVDLWGKLRAGRSAAEAQWYASRYSAQTVRMALAAQVASTYFNLRALDAELSVARATLATRVENLRLQRSRYSAGVANEFEVQQADAERAAVAALVPALERAVAQAESALAVLAGRSPRGVYTPVVARGAELEKVSAPPEVPSGLPSDLLARRPDLRSAEANLASADARIDEARAQYFPSLSLTASYGGESTELSDLLTAPARVWSIAGGLLQPIIGIARIGAQVDAATARREQAVIAYQQAVQSAFRDAHDALAAHRSARAVFVAQEERRAALAEALRLADLRYRNGYSSYLEVLDAQRNLLAAERERLNALRDRQTALVDLYKALGGGWPGQIE
jgi:multidrug efflux system outer membrane protein